VVPKETKKRQAGKQAEEEEETKRKRQAEAKRLR